MELYVPFRRSYPRTRYAEPGDWEQYRQIIDELYRGRQMTLKKVMKVMEREHNFKATPKMYKDRIKTWGFDTKTNRSKSHNAKTSSKGHIDQYTSYAPKYRRSPSPASPLELPEYDTLHELLKINQDYFHICWNSGCWDYTRNSSPKIPSDKSLGDKGDTSGIYTFTSNMIAGIVNLSVGDYKTAEKLFVVGLAPFAQVARSKVPSITDSLLVIAWNFCSNNQVCLLFQLMQHLDEIFAATSYPSKHPLRLLVSGIMKLICLSMPYIGRVFFTLLRNWVDVTEKLAGPFNKFYKATLRRCLVVAKAEYPREFYRLISHRKAFLEQSIKNQNSPSRKVLAFNPEYLDLLHMSEQWTAYAEICQQGITEAKKSATFDAVLYNSLRSRLAESLQATSKHLQAVDLWVAIDEYYVRIGYKNSPPALYLLEKLEECYLALSCGIDATRVREERLSRVDEQTKLVII